MSERTPEERERARLEREARRAARAKGERPPREESGAGLRLPKLRLGRERPRDEAPGPGAGAPPAAGEGPGPFDDEGAAEPPVRREPPPREPAAVEEPPAAAVEPAATFGEPEPIAPEPEPLPAEPEQAAAPDEPLPAEPEPAAAPDEPLPSEAEPITAAEEPLPAEPEQAAAPDEPLPAEPEQAAAPDEPLPAEPEHAAAPDEPLPAAPEPAAAAPEPPAPGRRSRRRAAAEPARDDAPLQPVRRVRRLPGATGDRDPVDAARRIAAARRGGGGRAPGGGPPTAHGGDGRRRRGPLGRILVVGAILAAAVLVWLAFQLFQPFAGEGEGSVRVAIPTGASVEEISDILAREGVVDDGRFFRWRVTISGKRGELKPGAYDLRRDMSYAAAIDELVAGPPNDVIRVTIPEGRSRREIDALVEDAGLRGDYLRATKRSRSLRPRRYGVRRVRDLEGFLWPATYELKRGSSVERLVADQLAAFRREFGKVSLRRARARNLTAYDVLIIASMIEREAMLDRERRLIASVIYNRLSRGEPLGIDATIRFATNNWTEPLTQSDLALRSPYNTRTRAGLPPGPIGNPGLESLRAAANPANTDFLFYVVKPGGCGEHAFSETLEEFERDAARYDTERARRGGRSPTDC